MFAGVVADTYLGFNDLGDCLCIQLDVHIFDSNAAIACSKVTYAGGPERRLLFALRKRTSSEQSSVWATRQGSWLLKSPARP
jgi:hypothetical protein